MEREHANAIISMSRTQDWKTFLAYLEGTIGEMAMMLTSADVQDPVALARIQGACTALRNVLRLEELAHDMNKEAEA